MNNWKNLKPESKLWIYGANRKLENHECDSIMQMLEDFCSSWSAHGEKLNCGFEVLRSQFILMAVDEESAVASGCSIDKSVEVFKQIDAKFNLDLFNRLRSYHVSNLSDITVEAMTTEEVKAGLESGALDENSWIVNMQALRIAEIRLNPVLHLRETWLQKYLPNPASV